MTNQTRTTTSLRADYQQAHARYQADPTNPQTVRALGWVYAHLLKEASGSTDSDRMLRGLALIADFPMVDDARWRESIGWSVCRFLLRHKPDTLPLGPLASVVRQGGTFIPAEPGLLRSVWWKALLRHAATGIDWLGLVAVHGWEGGFRPEDEQAEPYGDDKLAAPLLEGLVQAVAKQLLQSIVLPEEVAEPWLARLADLSQRHPDWAYLPYYQARLLLRLDRRAEAMAVFLPFARQRQQEFWVWGLLAELVLPESVGACYARALSSGTPEAFLVKLRQRVAGWLIAQNRWADARIEIERLVAARQANNWPVPTAVQDWLNDEAYTQVKELPAVAWYTPLLAEADALLWADMPETVAIVTDVDAAGHYVNIAIDARTVGSFPARRFGLRPAVGDRLALRYVLTEKNGRPRLQVLTATPTNAAPTHIQLKVVSGPLRSVPGKSIGFVSDVYVPATLLAGSMTYTDTLVRVEAIESWDAVKKKSGWRAFSIAREVVNLPM